MLCDLSTHKSWTLWVQQAIILSSWPLTDRLLLISTPTANSNMFCESRSAVTYNWATDCRSYDFALALKQVEVRVYSPKKCLSKTSYVKSMLPSYGFDDRRRWTTRPDCVHVISGCITSINQSMNQSKVLFTLTALWSSLGTKQNSSLVQLHITMTCRMYCWQNNDQKMSEIKKLKKSITQQKFNKRSRIKADCGFDDFLDVDHKLFCQTIWHRVCWGVMVGVSGSILFNCIQNPANSSGKIYTQLWLFWCYYTRTITVVPLQHLLTHKLHYFSNRQNALHTGTFKNQQVNTSIQYLLYYHILKTKEMMIVIISCRLLVQKVDIQQYRLSFDVCLQPVF